MASIACAVCAHPVPAGARFCSSCGAPVHGGSLAAEERRVVTVVFADLVGYTSLAEHLDPERVKRLVESCFERLVADIEAFGGKVDKLLGDAILALFGAPVAHEDDAERAVRAGLRMQQTLARFVAERPGAGDIQMRVGINTGEVLVGTLAGTEYTAMGDTVNTASRLQAMAPPGGVLIGAATAALCSAAIERRPFETSEIRGRQQLEHSWLVTGAAAAGSRPARCDVPFVGRVHERTLLDAGVDLVRAGHSGVVSIVGEAGIGKTRLADEILGPLQGQVILLRTACAPYGESTVWGPLTTGMAAMLDVGPAVSPDDLRLAVERRAGELWDLQPGEDQLERFMGAIAYLLGLPSELDRLDPAGATDRLAGLVADMMRRHAQTRMTVFWVDNLQWAEPGLLDLLAVVVRSLADLPFLLVTAHRPVDELAWPPANLERPLVVRVPLGLLAPPDATALVRAILDRDDPDGHLGERGVDELVERGGGNPLFLVELATMAATGPLDAELPGSLRALIAARLDQLPAAQRAIIDNAAILGTSDSVTSLRIFAGEMHQEFDVGDIDVLIGAGLLEGDGRWWRFRSDVVREVAYQTLTKRVRAQRHAAIAEMMLQLGDPAVEDAAYHAAAAAELVAELGPVDKVPSTITAKAVEALTKAAAGSMAAGRSEHAQRLASRALDLLRPDEAATERRLLLVRATAELDQRQFAAASADAQRVLDSARRDGDRVADGEARRRIGTAAHMQGDLDTARRELDTAVATFRALGDEPRLADALRARGFGEVFGGSLVEARRYLDEALVLYERGDDRRGHAWTLHNHAWVAFQAGDFADAEVQLAEACVRFEELGDRVGVSWAQGLRAFVVYFQRRFDEAEELATTVAAEAKRWGDMWAYQMMQTLLANMRLWTGRLAEAEHLAERALAGFRESEDRYGAMMALAPLNRSRVGLGKLAEAQRGNEEAVALGCSFGELALALQGAAALAVHVGDADQALVLADQVLERHRQTGSSSAEALVVRALALCQLGRSEEAMATIEEVDVADFPFGMSARALVRAISGDVGGARADADAVADLRGASYFDLAVARLGGVLVAARTGDADDRRERLTDFSAFAASAGDVVFVSIGAALEGALRAGGRNVPLGDGWRRIVDTALTSSTVTVPYRPGDESGGGG